MCVWGGVHVFVCMCMSERLRAYVCICVKDSKKITDRKDRQKDRVDAQKHKQNGSRQRRRPQQKREGNTPMHVRVIDPFLNKHKERARQTIDHWVRELGSRQKLQSNAKHVD